MEAARLIIEERVFFSSLNRRRSSEVAARRTRPLVLKGYLRPPESSMYFKRESRGMLQEHELLVQMVLRTSANSVPREVRTTSLAPQGGRKSSE